MSDSWLKFISQDPNFKPTADAVAAAVRLVKSWFPDADEVDAQFTTDVEFIDAGSNWSGVRCPRCLEDIEAWWLDAMSEAAESAFQQLVTTTPCCSLTVSLNDLRYPWPVGFASFVLFVMNPNVSDISSQQERQLSECLGSPLRKIWAHI